MLLRVYAPEESWKSPLRREWLFIAISATRQILFDGLVSVVSVCSRAVYGQICGRFFRDHHKEIFKSNVIIA